MKIYKQLIIGTAAALPAHLYTYWLLGKAFIWTIGFPFGVAVSVAVLLTVLQNQYDQ